MKVQGRMSRLVSIVSVLMMTATGLVALPLTGTGQRAVTDAAAIGFTSHKDIDDPIPSLLPYPPQNTTVTATVKNTGTTAITSQFPVTMEVGKGSPETRFYEDAEGAWTPAGWSVTDFSGAKWHATSRTFLSPAKSAWCGLEDQAAVQYGSSWAESMTLTNSVLVPNASVPFLQFWHNYSTKFNSDGGYLEIRNMSVSPAQWERNITGNWSFTTLGYNATTASINPAQTNDSWCFGGDSNGWQLASVDLSHYKGYQIKVRFIFSSSTNPAQLKLGWFIDDVKISDSVTTPFQDAFDSMANWTAANMKGGGNIPPGWSQANGGNPYNATGAKCFTNNNPANGAYTDGEDSALVTPSISLAGSTNARLYFWCKISSQALSDGGFIDVQTSGGPWIPLQSPWLTGWGGGTLDGRSPYGGRNAFSNNPNAWTRIVFDLTQFSGSSVRIRFHFYSYDDGNTGFGWYLDEIAVVAWNFAVSGSAHNNAPALNPGQNASLNFTFDLSGGEGTYSFKLITNLPGDQDSSNDAFTIIIEVRKDLTLDVGVASNTVNIIHGRTQNLNVTVRNKGNMPNDITLRVISNTTNWTITLDRTNISQLKEGTSTNTTMRVTVPLNEKVGPQNITINATSKLNATQTREQTVEYDVVNTPPTARANVTPLFPRVFDVVSFDGSSSSDPDKDPLNYSWDFGDGTNMTYGVNVTHIFGVKGSYNVTLNVSDGAPGSYSTAVKQVNISDGPPIPKITIITKPDNGTFQINSPVEFNGSDSRDENTGSLSYEWDFGDGSDMATGLEVFHNFTAAGPFNVTLTVTDIGGQSNKSDPKTLVINDYPVAKISSPEADKTFLTTQDIVFSSNGSTDPDGDPLKFEWTDNMMPGTMLSTSASFTRRFEEGSHIITLTVYDGHGRLSYNQAMVKVIVIAQQNIAPRLENGTVTPKEGDQGTTSFNYTVRYFDENNDPPMYINILIDSPRNAPQGMMASDPLDNNYADGKDYYFIPVGALLMGRDSPHNFSFETADRHGSGRIATESYDGPTVRWYMYIGKDSWMPEIVPGTVYCIGNYRTFLSGVNITPPEAPANSLSLGLAFVMNTTAPADKWFWANVTIKYNNLNYSALCESSLKVFWSVDNQPWTPVPTSGLDIEDHFLWFNVTRPNAKYAVFGTPLPIIKPPPPPPPPPNYTMLFVGVGIAVVAVIGIVAFLMIRKKRAAVAETTGESGAGEATASASAKEAVAPRTDEDGSKVMSVGGESVKTFQPGGGSGVAIFRPGDSQKTKVFRPGGVDEPSVATPSTEGEEKIFKPEVRDVEEGETAEGPVVQEEAVRERVVEYNDERTLEEEETPQMPGARPAEEEIEEVEGKKPIPKPDVPQRKPAEPGPKEDEESLDDLMKELDK